MLECKHIFIGKTDGAHCIKCGIHMTVAEYLDYMRPKMMRENKDKPKRQSRKKVKTNE